jgi:hypothetical protein
MIKLPIRRSPVTGLVQGPAVPREEGEPPTLIEKTYEPFLVDARKAGRGRIRAATVEEANSWRRNATSGVSSQPFWSVTRKTKLAHNTSKTQSAAQPTE